MKYKNILKNLIISIAALLCLTGCTEKSNSENLRIAFESFSTLNPIMAQTRSDWNILYLCQSQLIRFYNNEIDYDAAKSFEVNNQYNVYTFNIREGLKWSDGSELNAEDFAYGIYTFLSPSIASPRASALYDIKNAKKFAEGEIKDFSSVGVKVIDELTLQIELEYPIVDYERTIASIHIYPASEEFVKEVGYNNYGTSADTLLYSGPYVISEWELNSYLKLEKNNDYWDSENTFLTPAIELIQVQDTNSAINMYENNEIDVILDISSNYYSQFEKESYVGYDGRFAFLWFNQYGSDDEVSKLFSNKNFRLALNYALNREEIVKVINEANMPANFVISPFFSGTTEGKTFNEEYKVDSVPLKGSSVQANKYLNNALAELGYKNVSELPKIKFVTYIDDVQKLESELIIDTWKQVLGIDNIELVTYDIGAAIGSFYNLSYDIFSISIESNVRPTDLLQSVITGNTYNAGIYKNAEFDNLVSLAIKETNENKRAELIQKAEQIFLSDSVIVPLHYNGFKSAVKPYVKNYSLGFIDGFEFQKLEIK